NREDPVAGAGNLRRVPWPCALFAGRGQGPGGTHIRSQPGCGDPGEVVMTGQSLLTRKESDSLGEVTLASDCLYGIKTVGGRGNCAISHRSLVDVPAFIRALARVKKAAALANGGLGALPEDIANAIVESCDEIVEGRHHEHFVIDMLEGSGGTSI